MLRLRSFPIAIIGAMAQRSSMKLFSETRGRALPLPHSGSGKSCDDLEGGLGARKVRCRRDGC